MENVVYIHGAGQSPVSFNYIQLWMEQHEYLAPHYNIQTDTDVVVDNIGRLIKRRFGDQPVNIISHSFGGLLAVDLYRRGSVNLKKLVTMSTPWAGSRTAKWLGMVFRQSRLFENVKPDSDFLKRVTSTSLSDVPHLNVISEGGGNAAAGFGSEPNDGMITVASQEAIPDSFETAEIFRATVSHGEILMSYDVVNRIKEFLYE